MKYNQNKKERKEQGFDILPTKIWEDKQLKPSTILVYNKIVALSRNSGYSYACIDASIWYYIYDNVCR